MNSSSCTSQVLAKHWSNWSNNGQILVKYWSNTGQILIKIGQMLAKYRSNTDHNWSNTGQNHWQQPRSAREEPELGA
jgi:hypothetical protein